MAGQMQDAGQAMEAAFNNGAAAASKTAQAVTSLAETEEQAAERIRLMVAASLQQASASNEAAQSMERASTSTRRTTEEQGSLSEAIARVNAQMFQARSGASTVVSNVSSQESQAYVAALQRQFDMLGKNAAEQAAYEVKLQGGTKALQQQAYALVNNAQALREQITAEERSGQAAENFLNKLREQTATLGMNKTQLLEYKAAQLGVAEAAAPMIAKIGEAGSGARSASGHMDGLNFSTAGAKRELLVLAHELSQGNFQRFGGSLMVLGEQTGAAGLLFSSTGLAAIALTAAVVGVGVAMIKGASDQKHMDDALIMTGNYAGATSDKLSDLAHQAVETGGSIGEAKKVVTELAANGKLTIDQIGKITEATVAWEHATGRSAKSIIKEFESLAVETTGSAARSTEAVSRAALKLDDSYHFLTESVYEQIRALEREGNAKAASALATETFAHVTKERAEQITQNLGGIARAWNAIKEAAGTAVDAIGQAGARATPASDVKKVSFKLQMFDEGLAESNKRLGRAPDAMSADMEAARMKIVRELTAAVVKLNEADAQAIAQGNARIAESEANHAAARVAEDDRRLQKKGMSEMQVQLDQYRSDIEKIKAVNPDSILVTPDAVAAHEAAIVKAHTAQARGNDDRAKLLQDALIKEQTALDREKDIYSQRDRMLALYHAKFGLSDADFYAGREAARNEYIAAEAAAYAREAALIQGTKANTPQELAARQEKYDALLKQHLAFTASMRAQSGEDSVNEMADTKKQFDDVIKAIQNTGVADGKRLDDSIAKQKQHNAEIGKTKEKIEQARQATEDLATAQIAADAEYLRGLIAKGGLDAASETALRMRLSYLDSEVQKRRELSKLLETGAQLEGVAAAKKELDKLFDPTKAQSFGDALRGALGAAGDSMSKLIGTLETYGAKEAQIAKARAAATTAYAGDAKGMEAISAQITEREVRGRLSAYSSMAGAAKGFFSEQSKGYKALQAAEQVFRAAELAMAISNMVTKSGLITAFTGLFVASKATETAATVASVGPDVAASMTKGAAAATAGVAAQAAGDPYTAFARMAAMAALMAALGFAVAGGSGKGVDVAKQRQEAAGTGTVLGDATAKSDSIARSMAEVSKNSSLELSNTAGMLRSLQNIESSISGLGSLVARQLNITSPTTSTALGFDPNNVGTAIHAIFGGNSVTAKALEKIPVVGELLGGLMSTVGNFISKGFGTKTSLVDNGIYVGAQSVGSIATSGLNATAYADIEKTKKFAWISYSKSVSTEFSELSGEVKQQLGLVINNLAAGTQAATSLLGLSSDEFTKQMNGFVVDLGKISLKGLTGDQIQKQFEAIFSSLGDKMAQSALPGLENFQKVGEGYFETLTRIATDYANVDLILSSANLSFGAVGVSSIAAREQLIDMAGGIDNLAQLTSNYSKNFLTEAEQLAPVTKYVTDQMAAMGLASVTTREQFKDVVNQLSASGALATEAGAQQYTQLMKLADAFAQVHPELESTVSAAKSAAEILDERKDLQKQIDALTLTSDQLREQERASIDASNLALFDRVTALNKEAAVASEREKLQSQLDNLTMSSAQLLAQQRDALDASNRALFDEIQAQEVANKAKDIATKQRALDIQLMEATGDAAGALAAKRADELTSMDESLRATQRAIYAAQDSAAAYTAMTNAANKAKEIATKQRALDIQLMEATGDTAGALAAKRADELAGMDESLRATQRAIYAAQDSAAAYTAMTSAAKAATDAAMQSVQKAIAAEKTRVTAIRDAANESVNSIKGVFDLLKDQITQIYQTVSSTATMLANDGNAFIDQALMALKTSGYLPDQEKLAAAISAARGGLDANNYATQFEADKAALVMAGKLTQIQDASGRQLSTAEQALKAANDQLTALDSQLEYAQKQVDALNGINTGVLSVADAVSKLSAAITAQKAGTSQTTNTASQSTGNTSTNVGSTAAQETNVASLTSAQRTYYDAIKNNPGQGSQEEILKYVSGLQDVQALASYESVSGIYHDPNESGDALMARYGYQLLDPNSYDPKKRYSKIPGFATGGDHIGGLRIVGENGPELEATGPARIWNAGQTRAMLRGGGNNERLESLVEGLTAEVQRLQRIVDTGNGYAQRTANAVNGNPEQPTLVEVVNNVSVSIE
nr:phage tail length tape measure family protein [Duganella lactea]